MEDFPKIYWGVVGVTIGIATVVNIINLLICRQRYDMRKYDRPDDRVLTMKSDYRLPVKDSKRPQSRRTYLCRLMRPQQR